MSVSKSRTVRGAWSQVTHNSSWSPHTRQPVSESLYGRDHEGAKAVYPGIREVCIGTTLSPLIAYTQPPHNVRIWNKYKDKFAKARLREMMIIE